MCSDPSNGSAGGRETPVDLAARELGVRIRAGLPPLPSGSDARLLSSPCSTTVLPLVAPSHLSYSHFVCSTTDTGTAHITRPLQHLSARRRRNLSRLSQLVHAQLLSYRTSSSSSPDPCRPTQTSSTSVLIAPPPSTRARLTRLPCTPLQKACELVKQAIDADVKQDWPEAFKLYK